MKICKNDSVLYVDVECFGCKRPIALSYTTEIGGRRYCYRCTEKLSPTKEIINKEVNK